MDWDRWVSEGIRVNQIIELMVEKKKIEKPEGTTKGASNKPGKTYGKRRPPLVTHFVTNVGPTG